MKAKLLLPIALLALAQPLRAQSIQTRLGDVKDSRTTGQFFAGLEVELKLSGDALDDAKSMRVSLETATDDTGRNLLDPEKISKSFETIGRFGQKNTVTLKLKNPARKAATVKEITGTLELFVPKQDPESTVTIESFQGKTNAPFDSPALQKANVTITAWNKEQFDALQKKQKEAREAKAADKKPSIGAALGDAFGEALGQLFGFGNVGDNDIAMQIADQEGSVVEIEFQDGSGKPIDTNGRSSTTSNKVKTIIFNFRSKLPENAKLVVCLSTPKALMKVPVVLKDVPLP